MSEPTSEPPSRPALRPEALSDEIRDGLLQDLVAVSLILRHLEGIAHEATCASIVSASRAV